MWPFSTEMSFDPRNILIIDFGQLGDVVLSLPALHAIRARFPRARITVAVGKPGHQIVEMSDAADETLVVDRVALRDGAIPLSLWRIARIVRDVRRRNFDFVIDLHSLSETNLLGYLSRAPKRLYARRPNRSLDWLANFRPQPPVEDQRKHAVDRYFDVLEPLKIGELSRVPRLALRVEDSRPFEQIVQKEKIGREAPLVGMFPGAGHPGRRWPLQRFAELADQLHRNDGLRTLLFFGPEEHPLAREARTLFSRSTIIVERLSIPQFAAALAHLGVFVSNNTGPVHIAAAVETPVVMLHGLPKPDGFTPIGARHRIIYSGSIEEVTADEVYATTRSVLTAERTASLFAS